MYESFFGLHTKPFELNPNPEFLYLSASHSQAQNYLQYGLKEKAGFILLTGEIGLGKTTLLRDMISHLENGTVLATLFNTQADPVQLLTMINEEFGIEPKPGQDKVGLLRDLNDFLLEQFARRVQPILVVDEAQNLSLESLEELRLLSNLETENAKLVQIVLSGQPELKNKLMQPEMRQLRQRISVSCNLTCLTLDEMKDYIQYRLDKAGNPQAVTFDEAVFPVLFSRSRGIPRVINVLCDYLMLTAFSEQNRRIDLKMVLEVADEIVPELGTPVESPERNEEEIRTVPVSENPPVDRKLEKQMVRPDFLMDTNRRLIQLLDALEEQSDALNTRFEWLERSIGDELKGIREHMKTLGGNILRISNRLDKL